MRTIYFPSTGNKNATPAMDSNAVSSGLAFLESELEKMDAKLREPLTSTTYPRDITINSGGGWIEATSVMNVEYAAVGGNDGAVGGVQNSIRRIQADVSKDLFPVHPYEITMSVKFMDVQRGNIAGRNIEQMYDQGIRLDFDKYMDSNVYVGLEKYGTQGLVNHKSVTPQSVAPSANGSHTEWAKKTPQEVLADINNAITDGWSAAGYDQRAIPNHILVPPKQYAYLVNTVLSIAGVNGSISLLEYIKQNNIAKDKGVDLFIGDCRWCERAGAGNKDRLVAYVNDPYFVGLDMPVPLGRVMTQPVISTASYDTLYAANVGVAKVHYIEPFVYRDGI